MFFLRIEKYGKPHSASRGCLSSFWAFFKSPKKALQSVYDIIFKKIVLKEFWNQQ